MASIRSLSTSPSTSPQHQGGRPPHLGDAQHRRRGPTPQDPASRPASVSLTGPAATARADARLLTRIEAEAAAQRVYSQSPAGLPRAVTPFWGQIGGTSIPQTATLHGVPSRTSTPSLGHVGGSSLPHHTSLLVHPEAHYALPPPLASSVPENFAQQDLTHAQLSANVSFAGTRVHNLRPQSAIDAGAVQAPPVQVDASKVPVRDQDSALQEVPLQRLVLEIQRRLLVHHGLKRYAQLGLIIAIVMFISGPITGPQSTISVLAQRGIYSSKCEDGAYPCIAQRQAIESAIDVSISTGNMLRAIAGAAQDRLGAHVAATLCVGIWTASTFCSGFFPSVGYWWFAMQCIGATASLGAYGAVGLIHLTEACATEASFNFWSFVTSALWDVAVLFNLILARWYGWEGVPLWMAFWAFALVVGLPIGGGLYSWQKASSKANRSNPLLDASSAVVSKLQKAPTPPSRSADGQTPD
jgi:hypothetical protein